jgi:DNA-binding transcriptional ArsR family regulator
MIANSQQKSVDVVKKTLREVIVDVIALRSRSGGASFGEIVTVIRNYWQRDDGKEMTDASISNHLIKMTRSGVFKFEDRPSTRPGGTIRYYFLNDIPTTPDTSKLILVSTEQSEKKVSLPPLSWQPPRSNIPRRANPLHQIGGAV